MEQLQIAVRQFDAKDYPKKSEDLDIPDLLDTEDAKESDACSLKTLFAFAIGKTRMRCVGSCQLEFFLPWMDAFWVGSNDEFYTVSVFEKEEFGVSLCTNIPQIDKCFPGGCT